MEKKTLIMSMVWLLVLSCCYAQNTPSDYLKPHNLARAEVGVAPLVWNYGMVSVAKQYLTANMGVQCELLYDIAATGINVFSGDVSITASGVVNEWVSLKSAYDYATNECTYTDCSFYLQVVWNTTTSVACYRAQCPGSNSLWGTVCLYNPAGNIADVRPY